MRCIICTLDLYNVKTRNMLKIYVIVTIEFSIKEKTQKPKKEKLNLLQVSEIIRTIY